MTGQGPPDAQANGGAAGLRRDPPGELPVFEVSQFVAVFNQTLEHAYPSVIIQGELADFRVSKNQWVYFDLKDEFSAVNFFGSVYQLPGPLEDGLLLQVRGRPRLHPSHGFSVNVQTIQVVGQGSIKRAAALLEAKLAKEGLFDPRRKRPLPHPPRRVGLITAGQSAAYADFIKILRERWGGVTVCLADVSVQGEAAPGQIVAALRHFNLAEAVDVVVITRGGGSYEDLAAFNTEQVARAVAASRTPTLVAIGHETDHSLAEMAADQRASTPSNAAQLLVPDKKQQLAQLPRLRQQLEQALDATLRRQRDDWRAALERISDAAGRLVKEERRRLELKRQLLATLDPRFALGRGWALVRKNGRLVRSVAQVRSGDRLRIDLADGDIGAVVE